MRGAVEKRTVAGRLNVLARLRISILLCTQIVQEVLEAQSPAMDPEVESGVGIQASPDTSDVSTQVHVTPATSNVRTQVHITASTVSKCKLQYNRFQN